MLLVTGFDFLQGEVERIVAAAGGLLRVVADVAEAAPYWDSAAAVLVGSDIRELPPRRRAPAVLVGLSGEGDSLWHLAAAIGAQRVAVLPDAAAWLAEYLSRSRSPEAGGLVLGVTGGCGGAGATTAGHLDCPGGRGPWRPGPARGRRSLGRRPRARPGGRGIAGPPLAGPVGCQRQHRSRAARGRLARRRRVLVPVLARQPGTAAGRGRRHRRRGPRRRTAGLRAGRRRHRPRNVEPLRTFAWDCDRLLVVVPAQLKAAVASARLLQELPPVESALVIRGKAGAALDGALIAESVGLPLHGLMPEVRGTASGHGTRPPAGTGQAEERPPLRGVGPGPARR